MNGYAAALAIAAAVASSACSTERLPPPIPAPVGEYRGQVTLESSARPARLSVVEGQDGLRAALALDDGTVAFGSAQWLQGTLFLGLDYGHTRVPPCEGRLLLEAVADAEHLELKGELHSKDCTGSARGAFQFELFTASPALPAESLTPLSGAR